MVEVTLSNGSSAPTEASNALLRATSGNGEAGTVFDGDRSTLPTSRVLPGKSLKWRQAFGQPGWGSGGYGGLEFPGAGDVPVRLALAAARRRSGCSRRDVAGPASKY